MLFRSGPASVARPRICRAPGATYAWFKGVDGDTVLARRGDAWTVQTMASAHEDPRITCDDEGLYFARIEGRDGDEPGAIHVARCLRDGCEASVARVSESTTGAFAALAFRDDILVVGAGVRRAPHLWMVRARDAQLADAPLRPLYSFDATRVARIDLAQAGHGALVTVGFAEATAGFVLDDEGGSRPVTATWSKP